MESRFNVGDKVLFQEDEGKFIEGTVKQIDYIYLIQPNGRNQLPRCISQGKVYKDKQEVIDKLGLND